MRQALEWWGASRRRRGRIVWAVALLAVAGGCTALVLWMRDTGHSYATPTRPGPSPVYRAPKRTYVTRAGLRAARLTIFKFLQTAVLRDHVQASWPLVAPALRKGYTHSQWARGEIPVVPYPVNLKTVRYRLEYSFANGGPDGLPLIGLEVWMQPKPGIHIAAMRFGVEMEASGKRGHQRWLVSSWAPRGELGGEPQGFHKPPPAPYDTNGTISPAWLIVPGALLACMLLIPIGFGIRSWARNRRIARMYSQP